MTYAVPSMLKHTLLIATLVAVTGCGTNTPPPSTTAKPSGHDHAETGPHGGDLIELGDETYHIEFIHDDKAGEVTFYVLDSTAKKAIPIDAAELVVNAKVAGAGKQFKVASKADTSDPAGKSSKFFSADKELAAALDAAGAEPVLVVTIEGKQYRGSIAHDHDDHKP